MPTRARPAMAHPFHLQFEPAQDSWVLVSDDKLITLNAPAAEILRRCDGRHTVHEIVSELELAFEQPGLLDDVCDFLQQAQLQGWVQQVGA